MQPGSAKSETKWLGQVLVPFKVADSLSQSEPVRLSFVRFLLPDGTIVNVDVVQQPKIMLGRSSSTRQVDIDLSQVAGNQSGVSRSHAVIEVENHAIFVRDLNSRNGTFLNGERLQPMHGYSLHHGDELMLGRAKLRVKLSY